MPKKKELAAAGVAVEEMKIGEKSPIKEGKPKKISTTVNITDTREYLVLMARDKGISMSSYIQGLIEADRKKNAAKFEELRKNPPIG